MSAEPIHTLESLASWTFSGTALAVVGHPIAHSLSPVMHNAALAALAREDPRFGSWRYFKFDVPPQRLAEALPAFRRAGFRGLNLTVPHKSLVIPELAAKDSFVRAAGAANTLQNTPAGWDGANTDGYGLAEGVRETFGVSLADVPVVLLGAGGAARGAAVECISAGCPELWIGNRTAATAQTLVADLDAVRRGQQVRAFDLATPGVLPKAGLLINATSLGLKPTDAAPVDLDRVPRPRFVYDMIYRPAQTALLRRAAELGVAHANGLSMLIHQGARSLELWTGRTAPVDAMRRAVEAALSAP